MSFDLNSIPHSSSAVHFILVRHGETFRNTEGKEIQGWIDDKAAQLTSDGEFQADKIGERLRKKYGLNLTVIYTSPLGRCMKTAEKIARHFPQAKIFSDDRLKEICHGPYDTMSVKERNEFCLSEYNKNENPTQDRFLKWRTNPLQQLPVPEKNLSKTFEGKLETIFDLFTRAREGLVDIAKKHPGEAILVSTHGALIKTLTDEAVYRKKNDSTVLPPYFESQHQKTGSKTNIFPINCTIHHFVWDNQELTFWGTEDLIGEKKV